MISGFDVYDWYWVVSGSTTHVFNSRRFTSVVVGDSDYQGWLAKGFPPRSADTQEQLDDVLSRALPWLTCTPWQIREALNQLGWRNDVESAIAQSDPATKDAWQVQQDYRFNNARLIAMAKAIGKDRNDLITLFKLASNLTP